MRGASPREAPGDDRALAPPARRSVRRRARRLQRHRGRAAALEFGRRGARVVVASRGVQAVGTLVDELTGTGAQAVAVPTDITDEAAVDALVRAAEERFGRVDTRAAGALARPGELLLRARRLVRHR